MTTLYLLSRTDRGISSVNPRRSLACQTRLFAKLRAWRGSRCRRACRVHRQQNSGWPRHVRIGDIEPTSAFERRSSLTHAAHACSQDALGSAQPTRGPMISGKISTRTSLIRCRNPVAVRARASSTPAHRPTYPHSPRGLLASHASPLNGIAWWEASPDVTEHADPIYYTPE